MKEDWQKDIRIDDLEEPYFGIAEHIGLEATLKLAQVVGGSQVYFPHLQRNCNEKVRDLILQEFDGYNFRELARKYGYTERWIREICRERVKRQRSKPLDNQVSFWK